MFDVLSEAVDGANASPRVLIMDGGLVSNSFLSFEQCFINGAVGNYTGRRLPSGHSYTAVVCQTNQQGASGRY